MMTQIIQQVATELNLKPANVHNVIKLMFEEECTVPFVARYRKEMTGSMDEVQIRDVRDRYHYLNELETSKVKYIKVVEEHCAKNPAFKGKFEELKKKFLACKTRQELEDLYLPFKPKRRTRAMIAREKGLEPLLEKILAERNKINDLAAVAAAFVTPASSDVPPDLKVPDVAAALSGAADILAERINETAEFRARVRTISQETGMLVSKKVEEKAAAASAAPVPVTAASLEEKDKDHKGKKTDASKYENYFDYKESINSAPSHRVMAVRRGESEKFLRVGIEVDEQRIVGELTTAVLGSEVATDEVRQWLVKTSEDSYKRLMGPSIETEIRLNLKGVAEDEAINVFSKNLANLLLLPPIPDKVVMGVDPGLRTGSKLAVVDDTGKLLAHTTIYPDYRNENSPKNSEAKTVIAGFIDRFKVQCLAIGNGTGGREIDKFISNVCREFSIKDVKRVTVNEAGASVYSTDEIAREEFPDLDPTIRSSVSIARRLQDPLAELVKISPRSIGVGQYQHDVNPTKLNRSLEEVVESSVNKVGVNLNTASYKLLGYVSGVGPTLAKSIVTWRDKNGKFKTRDEVMKVSGFGPKVYQQSAGFLRVPDSANPLDNSSVHPERYDIVQLVAKDMKTEVRELIGRKDMVESIPWEKYVSQQVGMPTLQDIASELIKPGRDPREDGSRLMFSDDVSDLSDLKPGMGLKGTVTNVTNFGAFVDIGVHQDGLVHISELSDDYVKNPADVVSVGDVLNVKVMEVDVARRRISLSCKTNPGERQDAAPSAAEGSRALPPQHRPNRPGESRPGPQGASRQGQQGGNGSRGYQGGNQGGQQVGNRQGPPPKKKDERSFTMDDLLGKFNKR
jgi:uncharacterized protein